MTRKTTEDQAAPKPMGRPPTYGPRHMSTIQWPLDLWEQIGTAAALAHLTRTEYIQQALRRELEQK